LEKQKRQKEIAERQAKENERLEKLKAENPDQWLKEILLK